MTAPARADSGTAPAFLNCKGIGQPPLAVRHRGRWWRTDWPADESPEVLAFARSLGNLPLGMRRFEDYLTRTGKRLHDVPHLSEAMHTHD